MERKMKCVFFLVTLLVFVSTETVPELKRQLETTVNPGCTLPECTETLNPINVVYTKAEGSDDILHYLWSTIGAPTTLIVQTSKTAELNIEWEKLINRSNVIDAITFTETPLDYLGIILSKLIEFDDHTDTASLFDKNETNTKATLTENLIWDAVDISNSSEQCQAIFSTSNGTSEIYKKDGKILLQMNVHGNNDHDDQLPRLPFNSNSSQIRVILKNLNPTFNNSRYGLEIITICSNGEQLTPKTMDTINDENTPGVFKTVQVISSGGDSGLQSYFHWKPVAYTSEDFTVIESSDAHLYDFVNETSNYDLPYSIAKGFLNPDDINQLVTLFNITFGTQEDGFYKKTYYTAWSFISGIGDPIEEKFSLLVIMVIASGLGLPLLLMISSTVYICFHKYRQNKVTSRNLTLDFN